MVLSLLDWVFGIGKFPEKEVTLGYRFHNFFRYPRYKAGFKLAFSDSNTRYMKIKQVLDLGIKDLKGLVHICEMVKLGFPVYLKKIKKEIFSIKAFPIFPENFRSSLTGERFA